MTFLEQWEAWAKLLKVEVYTLYLACKDPRVPWYAKAFAACVAGYAFSPIDLIPDPIPVLGYLDDLILLPLGVLATRRLIPKHILDECRQRAQITIAQGRPVNRTAAVVIVVIWVVAVASAIWLIAPKAHAIRDDFGKSGIARREIGRPFCVPRV
jgi:uncharacterized membrane protein YkvA (DUF1232 family)